MPPLTEIFLSLIFNFSLAHQISPLPEEKLTPPIALSGSCAQVQIQEWQSKPQETQKIIQSLDGTCQTALDRITFFWKIFRRQCQKSFTQKISLLNLGTNFRELNDHRYRFSKRTKQFDQYGNIYPFLGYFDHSSREIYLLNDVNHKKFRTVLVHELYHARNYQCGFYSDYEKDEREARQFTAFLGLGE